MNTMSNMGSRSPGGFPMGYYPTNQTHMGVGPQYPGDVATTPCELHFQIPDAAVGPLIGKAGVAVHQVTEQTGARVTVSKKEEFYPGTQNRVVTITGNTPQVHQAHMMLLRRIADHTPPQIPQATGGVAGGPRAGEDMDSSGLH